MVTTWVDIVFVQQTETPFESFIKSSRALTRRKLYVLKQVKGLLRRCMTFKTKFKAYGRVLNLLKQVL